MNLSLPRQASTWLLIGGLLALLVGLAGGALLPLYTDEIGWRFQERAWLDGVDSAMSDICGPNTLAAPAFYMWPVRWFSATMNGLLDSPVWVRATGVALALVLLGMVWRLVRVLEHDAERRRLLLACAFALLATGTLPLVLVMSRPEQPVILAVLAMLVVTLSARDRPASALSVWLKGAAIVALAALALSYHLKGVLYAGVALVCVASLAPGRQHLLPRLVAGAALLALVALGADYWVTRFQCPADPVAAARLARNNLAATLAGGGSLADLATAIAAQANPLQYVRGASPAVIPMSAWYPIHLFSPAQAVLVHFAHYMAWLAATVMVAASLWAFWRREGFLALLAPRPLLVLALAGTLVAWSASQVSKNAYEGSHVFPAWIAAVLIAFTLGAANRRPSLSALRKLAAGLVALAIVSQGFTLVRVVPHLADAARDPGFLPRQPYSVSLGGYEGVRADIARAMAAEEFPIDRRLNRVLLDDVSYMALQGSYRPFHHLGVVHVWNGSIDDPAAYLASRGSDGAVAVCTYLWPEAQRVASRAGEICAVGPAKLAMLAGGRRFVEPLDR